MPPIGETLREARLRQGLEIAEVEQATKIRGKYLRALEAEEFDRLPGSTFVRTFLRTYAEYLGLDPQLLVEEYRATHESPADEEVQPFTPPAPTRARREGRRRGPGGGGGPGRTTMIAAAVVGILALLLVIGLIGGDGGEEEGDGRPAGAGADGSQRRDEKAREEPSGREGADRVSLRVEPAAETYLCVETGEGEELVNANVTAPETFEGETLRVLLGNTLAVELTANGEPVELEESPDPVGREITPDGDEELSTEELPCQ